MKTIFGVLLCLAHTLALQAQEPEALPIETFKTYRLVNGHTAETVYKGQLLLTFSHRFSGAVSGGIENFFGFDDYADIRFAFGYGITDRLTVEVGRTRTGKQYDLEGKFKFLQQKDGASPVSATLLASAAATTSDFPSNQEDLLSFEHRMRYLSQVFVARRFNNRLGGQITGAWVHRNLTQWEGEENNTFLVGAGARVMITNLLHLSAEYYQPLNNETRSTNELEPMIGFGVDFITPRHAFQVTISNTRLLLDQDFMTQTIQPFFDDQGIMLGFHITRVFF